MGREEREWRFAPREEREEREWRFAPREEREGEWMKPRSTDWGLAFTLAVAFGSGLWSLTAGRPEEWPIVTLHAVSGLWLGLLLVPKLARVARKLRPREPKAWFGLLSTLLAVVVLGTGVGWTAGGGFVALGYNLLNWHIVFGFALVLLVSLHMVARAKPLRRADLAGRRQALRAALIVAGGALFLPLKELLYDRLHTPGAARRFTGSRAWGHFSGNGFPVVSWVLDRPRPIDPARWLLKVDGRALSFADVDGPVELDATLDCTGGFYTTQRWSGRSVGELLDMAGADPAAPYVRFVSVTGYRWSLPAAQARAALVATRVGGELLAHGHGAPARLVAPGERGFVWVKWLAAIETRDGPDPGQLVAINTSWTSPVGKGEAEA